MMDDVRDARSRSLVLLAALSVLALVAGPVVSPAAAHAGATQITLEAQEDCPDSTYCFEVTQGSLDEVKPGEEINVTLVNPSSNSLSHNLHLVDSADADEGGDTAASTAEASTPNVSPGEQASFEFFVPQGMSGLYLWCDVGAHESQGMYTSTSFDGSGGQGDDGGDGGTNGSPGPGAIVGLLAVAGAALALRRSKM